MADLTALVDFATKAGLTGEALANFLRDERAAAREELKLQRETEEKEKAAAREEARIKLEAE